MGAGGEEKKARPSVINFGYSASEQGPWQKPCLLGHTLPSLPLRSPGTDLGLRLLKCRVRGSEVVELILIRMCKPAESKNQPVRDNPVAEREATA